MASRRKRRSKRGGSPVPVERRPKKKARRGPLPRSKPSKGRRSTGTRKRSRKKVIKHGARGGKPRSKAPARRVPSPDRAGTFAGIVGRAQAKLPRREPDPKEIEFAALVAESKAYTGQVRGQSRELGPTSARSEVTLHPSASDRQYNRYDPEMAVAAGLICVEDVRRWAETQGDFPEGWDFRLLATIATSNYQTREEYKKVISTTPGEPEWSRPISISTAHQTWQQIRRLAPGWFAAYTQDRPAKQGSGSYRVMALAVAAVAVRR